MGRDGFKCFLFSGGPGGAGDVSYLSVSQVLFKLKQFISRSNTKLPKEPEYMILSCIKWIVFNYPLCFPFQIPILMTPPWVASAFTKLIKLRVLAKYYHGISI